MDEQCITQKYKGGREEKKILVLHYTFFLKYIQSKISYISVVTSGSQTTAPVCKYARFLSFFFFLRASATLERPACAGTSLKAATYLVKE